MSAVKLHKGDELIMVDYVGTSIVDFVIELLNEDESAMDLTVYENLIWSVFAKRDGTVINSVDYNSGLTVNANAVTMNRSKLYSDLRKGLTYYHHLIGVRKLVGDQLIKEEDVLLYGPMEAI